jgi:hypothetical protein
MAAGKLTHNVRLADVCTLPTVSKCHRTQFADRLARSVTHLFKQLLFVLVVAGAACGQKIAPPPDATYPIVLFSNAPAAMMFEAKAACGDDADSYPKNRPMFRFLRS